MQIDENSPVYNVHQKPAYTLFNTRPKSQAEPLQNLVWQDGGDTLSCPTMDIQFLSLASELAASFLHQKQPFDKVIFISANAVAGLSEQTEALNITLKPSKLPGLVFLGQTYYAIGQATAKALKQQGCLVENLQRQQFDSESLLAQSAFQTLPNQRVLIVKGLGGRKHLEQALKARGAQVSLWSVYERQASVFCAASFEALKSANNPIVLWTSFESFDGFRQQLISCLKNKAAENLTWLLAQPCVVFSERLKQMMGVQGWTGTIQVVSTQSNAGIVAAIQKL